MASKQNIIYVYFKGKHLTISKSQYQYNHGQFLYFADLDLPQTFEVHFSNRDKGESKPQIGSNKLVEIPDEYFWSGALQIYAWIYLHSGVDDGETVYEVKIPLMKRAKPTDEEPLPQQQGVIDRAIAELNNAIEITTENANKTNADKTIVNNIKDEVVVLKDEIDSTATTINQKAQEAIAASERAETSAQNAATSENKALNYSQQAEQSAQSALESKNVAQQKAEVATNASNDALGYRNEALEAKNQAVQAKQNIVDYRNETKEYRDETLNLKNNVQTLKNQIDETAEEIDETASTVRDDAESANRSASSANESALQASQSANGANESKNQANTYKNEAKEYRDQAEEFKNQSEANVTHYPKIINDYWYVWDATNEEYINTNVDANGIKGDTGNGIESITLNDDYTLTIAFTDGTSHTTSSIRGEKGDTGESGVYIGTDEPTNENIHVWIDTDDDGTSEDLVKEIDELKENIYKPYAVDSASGAIASFSDGADDIPLKSLVVNIDPVQDLHGYDSPWVGGGGKNKFGDYTIVNAYIDSSGRLVSANNNRTYVIAIAPSTMYAIKINRVVPTGVTNNDDVQIGEYYGDGCPEVGETGARLASSGYVNNIYTGTFTTSANAKWLAVKLANTAKTDATETAKTVQVEVGSSVSATYTPYENICPISGWTGCEVNVTGINIWDEEWEVGGIKTSDGSTTTGNAVRSKNFCQIVPNTTYYTHIPSSYLYTFFYDDDKNYVGYSQKGNDTFTTPTNARYFKIQATTTYGTTYNHNISINYPSTDHTYHPYTGRSITIDLGQTVYGAKLYPLEGKVVVDRAMVDLGTLNWSDYSLASNCFKAILNDGKVTHTNYSADGICSSYAKANYITTLRDTDKTFGMGYTHLSANVCHLAVHDSSYSDAATFKTAMSGVQLCYELATPIEIQLSTNQINSLYGTNSIWADTGNTSIEYRADTKLYINKKITEAISALT